MSYGDVCRFTQDLDFHLYGLKMKVKSSNCKIEVVSILSTYALFLEQISINK